MPISQAPDKGDGPGGDPRPRPEKGPLSERLSDGPLDDGGAPRPGLPNIPHGPPFRLIDRVLHAEPERGHLIALRRLTAADALWPAEQDLALVTPMAAALPVELPRPLLIEALCQAAACLNALRLDSAADRSPPHRGYLVAISGFRFPQSAQHARPLLPLTGDTLVLSVTQEQSRGALVAFSARATLHRGAADPESLRRALPAQPNAQPNAEIDAVGAGDEEAGLLAAGRLLFAVTMA
ncbi:MAG: hypothetical protein U1A78_18725 [Polyangia bacterium]